MKEPVVAIVIGSQSMYTEGVVSTLERGRHFVERAPVIRNTKLLENYIFARRLLVVFIMDDAAVNGSIEKEIEAIRQVLTQAKIVVMRAASAALVGNLLDMDADTLIQCYLEPQALLDVVEFMFSTPCRLLIMPSMALRDPMANQVTNQPDLKALPKVEALLPNAVDTPTSSLSKREHEIVLGLSRGETNKHIARRLSISEATVKAHVRSILQKLGAENRTQAALKLLGRGVRSNLN